MRTDIERFDDKSAQDREGLGREQDGIPYEIAVMEEVMTSRQNNPLVVSCYL
jgi:hypothetical protein